MRKPDGREFEGSEGDIPGDGASVVMTDLVQWLDIFVAFMCSNYKYVHVTVELNLGMQIEISYVCITFRKKVKSNWFLLGSCPSYFESGSSS